jgi:hypothetical protein
MILCAEAIVILERIEAYAWLRWCCSTFSFKQKLDVQAFMLYLVMDL